MADPKLTDEQREEVARRHVAGETMDDLAKAFGVVKQTIHRICKQRGAVRDPAKPAPANAIEVTQFTKRVRSVLWRQDNGADKKTYDAWSARVAALESPDGGGYTKTQAVVRASKEFPCLHRLFREYDLTAYDPNPDSHPTIQTFGKPVTEITVMNEGIEQSYRESLRWAIDAAGEYLNTGKQPATCPCNAAFFLYRQALGEPRDFLAKLGQIEIKADVESEAIRSARKAGNRSVAEIDAMLDELDQAEERVDDEIQ